MASEYDIIADRDMPPERDIICDDHIAADLAIVPDMRSGHEKAVIPDLRHSAIVFGPGIHRHAFADIAVAAHYQLCWAPPILDRLWRGSKRGERINYRAGSDGRVAGEMNIGDQPAAIADGNVRPN